MRLIVLALVFVMVSSCLAANRKSFKFEIAMHEQEQRHLLEDKNVNAGYPGNSVNNHHYIPRQDFNNFGGDGGNGGSG